VSASVVSNSCRLTVVSAALRVDLAVPVQLTIGELLSMVVASLGRETADQGIAEGGWVLQRAGESALNPSATVAASQLRDGDVLHLRTRATRLPELTFDDVLEAVATGVLTRTARWQPIHTARASAAFAAALLAYGLAIVLTGGPKWAVAATTAGVAAVLLILAAVAVGRVYHRRGPSLTVAGFALAYAAVSGAASVGGHHSLSEFGAPQILVAACASALAATILLVALADGVAGFVAVIVGCVLTAVGTAVASGTDLTIAGTAAVIATAALAISPVLPTLSFKLSRLPLPPIPTDAADLRRDTGTVDAQQILGQAVRADQFLTGLVAGVGLSIAGAAALNSGRGPSEYVLAGVLGVICLLRARLFTGRAQRSVLLVSGGVALVSLAVGGVLDTQGTTRLLAYAAPAVVLAVILSGLAVGLPERRYTPGWSRTADIVESMLVLSVIPLALAVMGVYGAIRVTTSG
jgi:type VII secretion integral membrane protein EccD